MRSFTGTLLFEECLDTIPPGSITSASVAYLLNPIINIVEENCDTNLGTYYPLSADLIGKIDRTTGNALTQASLTTYSNASVKEVPIRETYSCASRGGVCKKCYQASYPKNPTPTIGVGVKIPSRFFLRIEHTFLDAAKTCTLTLPVSSYDTLFVYRNDVLLSSGYTATDTSLTIPSGSAGDRITVKYEVFSNTPFMQELSSTFAGALLGMRGIPARPIPLRKSLYSSLSSQDELESLISRVVASKIAPDHLKTYLKSCKNEFEKTILACAAAAIFIPTL